MKTVHMVGNAHLDPAWLWGRAAGADAAVATTRTACDLLDEYPGFIFTCSGSWWHQQVERFDPDLFERVRAFARAGRWQPVGGMVIEPDCNLPSQESFRHQLEAGQGYFRLTFGRPTTVGYNIDSFGHCAYMPRFLRQAGIGSYVFMRPGPHEKQLPGGLFRWQSPDGDEVLAFRIAGSYLTQAVDMHEHVEQALAAVPDSVDHVMCFYGIGDHGGGPSRAQIEWILEHRDDIPGRRLVFSHPVAFFEAIAPYAKTLPVVAGELQHHAIGCYSVERRIKVAMRRAEARLRQAEQTVERFPSHCPPQVRGLLAQASEKLLFNQFHDILDGTSIDRASRQASGELLWCEGQAEDAIALVTRRSVRPHAKAGEHRIAVFNADAQPFDGWVTHEPWCEGRQPGNPVLLDEQGVEVPSQRVEPLSKVEGIVRLLFRVSVPARDWRILRLMDRPHGGAVPADAGTAAPDAGLRGDAPILQNQHVRVQSDEVAFSANGWSVRFDVHDDFSDTWSHSCINRFQGPCAGSFLAQEDWHAVEAGPLRDAIRRPSAFGASRLWCRLMLGRDEPVLWLRLSVVWAQARQMLRLHITPPAPLLKRTDLVSGGPLARGLDGLEYPLNGGTLVEGDSDRLTVAAPEVFSISAGQNAVGFTLLRSPYVAHHEPKPAAQRPDHPVTDQGYHEFDLALWPGCPPGAEALAGLARDMMMPPIVWDLTG